MSDDGQGGVVERWARRVGITTPFEPPAGFVFVLAASGAAASLAGVALALFIEGTPDWKTASILFTQSVAFAGALGLLRAGSNRAAAWALMLTAVAVTSLLVLTGDPAGYDDLAIMLYGVLAIGAAVLFEARGFSVALALVMASLVLILIRDLGAALPVRSGSPWADFGFAALIVLVTGLGSYSLAANLRRSNAERQRQEDALRQANLELEMRNSELERFAYTISHELKSPLVTIGGFLPLFKRSLEKGQRDSADRYYQRVEDAHGRMNLLLSELLELCRLGFLHDPVDRLPLAEVVSEAHLAAEESLRRAGVALEVAADLPAVRGDRRRLVEVFQNLLENAARFTAGKERPRVEIAVRGAGDDRVVVVRDNGIGIAPAHHERVFELFHKLDAADHGTGVGLAIVSRIVELHEGRIWVESEGEGHGTAFCISMPWAAEKAGDPTAV